jgi:hypothetical protein
MKTKKIGKKAGKSLSLFFGITLALTSLSTHSFAGWEYKSVESIDRMDGRTYLVSHCENKIGDDCTTPGSATRIDISVLAEFLESAVIYF